eukprot:CAMPEP_0205831116 /NCGR_PEP_ID=MMETSP0206-20130828/43133_1 /ASSEMBLY_ACC=CAM_ASM_000279 /TAXON_ID=36767 /ORGANISM="Euplotes focardii, Strain TN1" /LENGTH=73 /DNA_ID=CAMNT_0053135439 /DNA_START=107 /DNA_END=325 /DNA_ORIENTATION=+
MEINGNRGGKGQRQRSVYGVSLAVGGRLGLKLEVQEGKEGLVELDIASENHLARIEVPQPVALATHSVAEEDT